ncbi:MAG: GNAT family N-acetyltransferase [Verrucomicrobia bacterium]|nr:GNAT family N-acetyltransferase [Verrucomicrobiota bacterium]MBS0638078.1 GNAT family N-acetyltransferase [Verrucomicrobiota bacterium]
MQLDVVSDLRDDHVLAVHALYQKEWWTHKRSLQDVEHLLSHSLSVALVEKTSNTLVAYSRVVTDYLRHALIYDVIVDESYRKKQVGRRLMEAILSHPELQGVVRFELKCLPELVPFYAKCGFTLPEEGLISMIHVRKEF